MSDDPLCPPARRMLAQLLAQPGQGRCVAFDADGTLWRGDVGEDLLRYLVAEDLLPRHRGRKGLYQEYEERVRQSAPEAYCFAVEVMEEMEEAGLATLCRDFFHRRFAGRVFRFVRPLLEELRRAGFTIWIVSASPRWIVQAGGELLGIPPTQVLAMECAVEGGRLTRRVKEPIPCGEGKARLLEERGLRPALAAGNGELDLPMLEAAGRALVVAPHGEDGALVRVALARGWPVQRG